jgi:hypothetical protein
VIKLIELIQVLAVTTALPLLMKLLCFLFFFLTVYSLFAQDTVLAQPTPSSIQIFDFRALQGGCAHGHICCSVGCHCCVELRRAQVYDTIYHPMMDGIERITIVERYSVAESHERSPVHFRFKNSKGELSQKWFRADLPTFYYSFDEISGFKLYEPIYEQQYQEQNAVLVQNEQGDFCRIDLKGNVLPMVYDHQLKVNEHLFISFLIHQYARFYCFTDSEGTQLTPLKYSKILPFDENGKAIVIDQSGKRGLFSDKGKWIFTPIYDELKYLEQNRYLAFQDNQKVLLDGEGKTISVLNYEIHGNYAEGLITAKINDKKWAVLDLNGKEKFTIKAQWMKEYHEGLAAVYLDKKYGFVNTNGELVIDHQFDQVHDFQNGVAPVSIGPNSNTDAWGLINTKGKFINSKRYDEITRFKGDYARVRINGKGWGMIDHKGHEIMECLYFLEGYGASDSWLIEGTLLRSTVGKKESLELVDIQGNIVTSLQEYSGANYVMIQTQGKINYPFLITYQSDNRRNLINFQGETVLKKHYQSISVITEEIAFVTEKDQMHLVEIKSGKLLQSFPIGTYFQVQDEIIMMETKDYPKECSYYNLKGEKIKRFY